MLSTCAILFTFHCTKNNNIRIEVYINFMKHNRNKPKTLNEHDM